MPKVLYSADHHLFHKGILTLQPETRPFGNLDQMHEYIIHQHNSVTQKDDDVFILGDFAHKSANDKDLLKIFNKMNGRKHLIIGNHDKANVLRLPWASHVAAVRNVKDGGNRIFLCHYGVHSWDGMYSGGFHFYGHTHGKLPARGRSTDVGVDAWDMRPVTFQQALERMMERNVDFETYRPERRSVITCAEENCLDEDDYETVLYDEPGYGGHKAP